MRDRYWGTWYHNDNVDDPPKQGTSHGGPVSFAHLKDCPKCKYGTLEYTITTEGHLIEQCIDCEYINKGEYTHESSKA